MSRRFLLASCLAVSALGAWVVPATAATVTHDFESSAGLSFYADPSCSAGLSTTQVYAGSSAVELSLNAPPSYARVKFDFVDSLGSTTATAKAFVSSSSTSAQILHPYFIFDIDTNNDNTFDGGTNDSQIIAFNDDSNFSVTDAWFDIFLNDSTKVHVVGARPGLAAGTYSSSGTQDTLANLRAVDLGGSTWGDLNVLSIRIGYGLGGGGTGTLDAFVDNAVVTGSAAPAVPLPGAAGMGLGLVGLLGLSRRRKA